MSNLELTIIGVISAIFAFLFGYLGYVIIRLIVHKNKLKNIFLQIKGQVDIKHDLLKEYIEINKDVVNEEYYHRINEALNAYSLLTKRDIEKLKSFNNQYSEYMNSFDDTLLKKQCSNSQKKINHIKDYYNELVEFYNSYIKNLFLTRIVSLKVEMLY